MRIHGIFGLPPMRFTLLHKDRGRSGDATPRPSHQTGQAVFPHPAFQSAFCSLLEAGQFPCLGRFKAEEPKGVKVSILPPVMVPSSRSSSSLPSFAQDSAQSSPHPSVHFFQQARMGVFEVSIPAPQDRIELRHNRFHASPAVSAGFRCEVLPQFPFALRAHQPFDPSSAASPKPIPKEVEVTPWLDYFHHSGLFGMQCQASLPHPFLDRFQCFSGLPGVAAQHNHRRIESQKSKGSVLAY